MKYYSIKLITDGKIIDYPKKDKDFEMYDNVLVETTRVTEVGNIINTYESKEAKNELGDGKILRKVNKEDKKNIQENKKVAHSYIPECEDLVKKNNISMNIIDADLSYDQKKLTFYFSANSRVDFRRLVGELVKAYKKLIRLQQVGSREQVKKMGGYGKCGQHVCCNRFLDQPGNVDMSYATNQNMVDLSSKKLNGLCGKMMCCMEYENEAYMKAKEKMPKIGDIVKTTKGKAEVVRQNVMQNKVYVRLQNGEIVEVKL